MDKDILSNQKEKRHYHKPEKTGAKRNKNKQIEDKERDPNLQNEKIRGYLQSRSSTPTTDISLKPKGPSPPSLPILAKKKSRNHLASAPESTLNFPQTRIKKRGCNRHGRNPRRLNPHYRRVLFSTRDQFLKRLF